MSLIDILGLKNRGMISLVGGGGKTTTMLKLGEELKAKNKKVLLTTTTAIGDPAEKDYNIDYYFLENIDCDLIKKESSITVFGDRKEGFKLRGGNKKYLDKLFEDKIFDFILIEADGAKMLPIKAPKEDEPVIPDKSNYTIGLIGIDAIGKKISDTVHRPELFLNLIKEDNINIELTIDHIIKLILDKNGLFKNSKGENILIINKANNEDEIKASIEIRDSLKKIGYKDKIIITNIIKDKYY